MSEKKPLLRKRILIVRAGQYTYGLAFALFAVALSAGMLLAAVLVFYAPSALPCPDGSDGCKGIVMAPSNLANLLGTLAMLTAPAALVSFVLGIAISHRTFGPLVRIKFFLEELTRGNYRARVQLRDKDHLGELAGMLNGLAEHLEKKHPEDLPAQDKA